MKKNTGQLWKSQYIISDRTAVLQNSEKMGYAQTKLQVEYEAEEYGKSEICCLDAETNTFLIQNLQKNLLQKMIFRSVKM